MQGAAVPLPRLMAARLSASAAHHRGGAAAHGPRSPAPRPRCTGARRGSRPPSAALADVVPAAEIARITEPAALDVASALRRVSVQVGGRTVQTAHVPPERGAAPAARAASAAAPPLVLIHGFDSSVFEFRRFLPELRASGLEAWALDVYGCGFTEFAQGSTCTPEDRREHLLAFIQQVVGQPCVVLGASLGASAAIDLAVMHPEWVAGLVLVDGQAFESAPQLPGPLAALGVQVLRAEWLRRMANQMAYLDKTKYATEDAMLIGRLHTHQPQWASANVAFIESGGYRVAEQVAMVKQPTLVVWGCQDEIVPPAASERFRESLKQCKVVMVDACGHVPHLEQPAALKDAVIEFMKTM